MTRPYEWRPIPHHLDIVCPACRQCAEFEVAETVKTGKARESVTKLLKSLLLLP
jgi:hypothetical protein